MEAAFVVAVVGGDEMATAMKEVVVMMVAAMDNVLCSIADSTHHCYYC